MRESNGNRDLQRLKWIGVILPVAFIWLVELFRFLVLDRSYRTDTAHLIAGLLMAGGVVVFAALMSVFLDRAERRLVSQNKDLTITHAVSSAVRGDLAVPDMLSHVLARLAEETDALAGVVRVPVGDGAPVVARHPHDLADRLAWVGRLLDEVVPPVTDEAAFSTRPDTDTGILDVPLGERVAPVGHLRLVFHPAIRPDISDAALSDIGGKIASAIRLGLAAADLRRREREQAALYGVALQLTGRADVRDVLQTISGYARDLLGADRVVVCLADPTVVAARGVSDRLAVSDDGSVCAFGHLGGPPPHARNPLCPMAAADGAATMASPLRAPDGLLGELCAIRADGKPFGEAQRSLLGAFADMAAIAVRTARLRDAEEQWTILAERDRIARELHDSLAQVLGVIHLRVRDIEGRLRIAPADAVAGELSELGDVADEAYRDVREAILGLRETIPVADGLEGALRGYLVKFSRQTGIAATLACEGERRDPLSPRTEVQLLRVVQEALTNVRKHAGATRVVVGLGFDETGAALTIEDDGAGFDPARVAESLDHGFGLTSMRERVEQVGGTLDVHTAPGQGTRIVVRLESEEGRVARSVASPSPAG